MAILIQNILSEHLKWVDHGYDFSHIKSVEKSLRNKDPFLSYGTKEISEALGLKEYGSFEITKFDFKKLEYLFIKDEGFDGNVDFLIDCPNLKRILICGICSEGKIESLKPLEKLLNLDYLSLTYHNISDLSPLKKLLKLKEIYLTDNPIKSIKPITHLGNIEVAEFLSVPEEEIFELLKNSKNCNVSYCSKDMDWCYKSFWLEKWAFKTTYFKDYTKISITIQPLKYDELIKTVNLKNTQYFLSLMRDKAKLMALTLLNSSEFLVGDGVLEVDGLDFIYIHFNFKKTITE